MSEAGEHLRGMTEELASLAREEVARVREETLGELRKVGVDLTLIGASGAAGLAGLFAGTVASIDALHGGTPPKRAGLPVWLSAVTVAALAGGAAFTLFRVAFGDLRERGVLPREAIRGVERTAGAVAGELRAGRAD